MPREIEVELTYSKRERFTGYDELLDALSDTIAKTNRAVEDGELALVDARARFVRPLVEGAARG